jgi:hypothetical protein
VIIALVVALLLAGGASSGLVKDLERDSKRAGKVLEGTEERKPALALLKSMRALSQESLEATQKTMRLGAKQARDHDRPSTEVAAAMAPYFDDIAAIDRQLLDRRDELRALLTRAQWDAIFSADSTASTP